MPGGKEKIPQSTVGSSHSVPLLSQLSCCHRSPGKGNLKVNNEATLQVFLGSSLTKQALYKRAGRTQIEALTLTLDAGNKAGER